MARNRSKITTVKTVVNRRRRRKPGMSRAYVKKIVNQTLSRQVEVKNSPYRSTRSVQDALATTWEANCIFPLSPVASGGVTIPQGVTQGSRIGNKIRTKSLIMKLIVYPAPYDSTNNPTPRPLIFKMWIIQRKQNSTTLPTLANLINFFQFGASTEPFDGQLVDLTKPINKDAYILKKVITFKLGTASYTGGGVQTDWQSFANNDFKFSQIRTINLTKLMHKVIKFDDSTADATTPLLIAVCEVVSANNLNFSAGSIPATMVYQLDYRYTDE